jgi:hypothetical protein
MIDSMINKLARQFRISQEVKEDGDTISLVTHSYLGNRIIYTYEMPLEPLYELFKRRLDNDTDKTP